MRELTDYIDWVNAHQKGVCAMTRLCVKRIEERIKLVKKGQLAYDDKAVKAVVRFIERLVADEGGQKIRLLLWQKFFIAGLYGFREPDTWHILHNDAFLFIAKKNGKTALSAGLALHNLINIPAAQVILVATDYNQAKIAFEAICKYIRNTPTLAEALSNKEIGIRESPPLTVEYYTGGSKIRIIPETRAKQAQGFNATFALFDEIASYRTGEIITKIASGQVRENAIRISLTTAETSMQNPGRAEYDRARNVLTGKFEARNYLPLIYELDYHDDRWNPDCYIKANPALDAIKPLRKLIEERDRARQNPIEEASFFAYQLNVWSQNSGADISDDDWRPAIDNAKKYADYLTPDKLAKYPAVAAVDLSKIDDYTAYTIYFYIKPIDKFFAKHRFYIPAAAVENKQRIETEQVRIWIKHGYITPTEDGGGSRVINYEYLEQDIIEDYSKYHLIGLTYDVAHATKFIESLEEKLPQLPLIPFAQGWKKISPANKQWLEIIYKQKLIDDNPVMRWMAGCARIINDRLGNTYFEKVNYRQSNLRIDGVDTSVMALAVLLGQLEQGEEDVEEQVKALEAIEY